MKKILMNIAFSYKLKKVDSLRSLIDAKLKYYAWCVYVKAIIIRAIKCMNEDP